MDGKYREAIESGVLEEEKLMNEKEIEVASKILNELNGTLAVRATSILKFCIKAIRYSKVNLH
ncbi:hypothetical protein [Clostridium baratii]|uniref:hypothetical protein n=1 Tax=Clostridium baratii TaxID=1561 RepID=UPI0030CB5940